MGDCLDSFFFFLFLFLFFFLHGRGGDETAWVSPVKIEMNSPQFIISAELGLLVLTRSYKYLASWQLNQARVAVITLSYL